MNSKIPEFREKLQKKLNPGRYEHSLSVAFTCICLAMRYGYSIDQAEVAGMLHDCAKGYDNDTIIRHCEKKGIEITEDERKAPAVLHAKYGAWLAENTYNIHDQEILDAIACHTTGKPAMGLLDKILYVADYIEARRDKAEDLPVIRRLAFEDLDEALYQILEGTLNYLGSKGAFVDPMTQKTYDYYKQQRKGETNV